MVSLDWADSMEYDQWELVYRTISDRAIAFKPKYLSTRP